MVIYYLVLHSKNIVLSAGTFITFQVSFLALNEGLISLSEAFLSSLVTIPLFERSKPIFETLSEYSMRREDPGELTGAIEVSRVSFRYHPEGNLVLRDISFQVKEGEYIGLVGASGSGKSTLIRILIGFEKPEYRKIFYDNRDLESLDILAIRRQLGVVM